MPLSKNIYTKQAAIRSLLVLMLVTWCTVFFNSRSIASEPTFIYQHSQTQFSEHTIESSEFKEHHPIRIVKKQLSVRSKQQSKLIFRKAAESTIITEEPGFLLSNTPAHVFSNSVVIRPDYYQFLFRFTLF